jgi:hypothetical protein
MQRIKNKQRSNNPVSSETREESYDTFLRMPGNCYAKMQSIDILDIFVILVIFAIELEGIIFPKMGGRSIIVAFSRSRFYFFKYHFFFNVF